MRLPITRGALHPYPKPVRSAHSTRADSASILALRSSKKTSILQSPATSAMPTVLDSTLSGCAKTTKVNWNSNLATNPIIFFRRSALKTPTTYSTSHSTLRPTRPVARFSSTVKSSSPAGTGKATPRKQSCGLAP